ncbi:MAG: D-alanine--D-alanine ligase family protein, partial [Microgenomates group bacterium]
MKANNVMVVYGGVSPEHEVAVITALQVMNALKTGGYTVMPVYISKQGNWFLGGDEYFKPETYKDLVKVERLGKRVILSPDRDFGLLIKGWLGFGNVEAQPEVVFPVIHGKNGEDGTLQGLFELANIPYVGCGVTASAVKIDKYLAKKVAQSLGIKVLRDWLVVKGEKAEVSGVRYPVFVKPVGLGSSIGLTRVEKESALADALEVAFCYDDRVMIEEAIDNPKEVNVSIMGNNPYELSVTEQPVASGEMLSFDDKYTGQSGKSRGMAGSKRYVPAKVETKIIKQIEENALKFFRAVGGKGIARVDFMVDKKGFVYFNEINTMPGSLAYYLWEKSGLPF